MRFVNKLSDRFLTRLVAGANARAGFTEECYTKPARPDCIICTRTYDDGRPSYTYETCFGTDGLTKP